MTLGLFFGIVTCTWPSVGCYRWTPSQCEPNVAQIPDKKETAASRKVRQLDFTYFDDQPVYLAAITSGDTRIVPVQGDPRTEYDRDRIFEMVSSAARPCDIIDKHVLTQYDRYYLDRHRKLPLPVLFVKLNDPQHTQIYLDQ